MTERLTELTVRRLDLTGKLAWVRKDLEERKQWLAVARTFAEKQQARLFIHEDTISIRSIEAALSEVNAEIKEETAAKRGELSSFTETLLEIIEERWGSAVKESLINETRTRKRVLA